MTGEEAKKLNANMQAMFVRVRYGQKWFTGGLLACVAVLLCGHIAMFIYDRNSIWMLAQAVLLTTVSIFSVIQHRLLSDELDIACNTVSLSLRLNEALSTAIYKLNSSENGDLMAAGNTTSPICAEVEKSEGEN